MSNLQIKVHLVRLLEAGLIEWNDSGSFELALKI